MKIKGKYENQHLTLFLDNAQKPGINLLLMQMAGSGSPILELERPVNGMPGQTWRLTLEAVGGEFEITVPSKAVASVTDFFA